MRSWGVGIYLTRRFDGFSDGIGIYALDVRKDVH